MQEVKMIDWFDSRYYQVFFEDGSSDFYPSVTTKLGVIAKPFLAHWRGDIGNREADAKMIEAQDRGTRIHFAWHIISMGGIALFNPRNHPVYTHEQIDSKYKEFSNKVVVLESQDEMWAIYKLKQFLIEVNPTILETEKTVYSHKYKEAGTLDGILAIDEGDYLVSGATKLHLPAGNYVIDIKSGKVVDKDAFLQIAAYANCAHEMGLHEIVGGLVLHTSAQTKKGIEGFTTHYISREELDQKFKIFRNVANFWEYDNEDAKPKIFNFPSEITLDSNIIRTEKEPI